ncbi:hypothetical protein GCM10007415_12470 [Parapedobacter pyrenivorans]|uniref:Uncharacterized protein n=1 Tax=Parapedobacter pyrenivorans TaxID=1305674 RepID=A0A917HJH1_9SPHI|nr:hypothetical protein [Parapedobacter pyrenivorans]GGG81341.1 hypothetical protein GCM10007415_12470 [Parapedobacter pyrenivorans]
MERIVLEVDGSLAQAWKRMPATAKQRFAKDVEVRLVEQIRLAEKDEFEKSLNNLRSQAAANGLTQEILEDLLREEG